MTKPHRKNLLPDGSPAVDQGVCNGWPISYNPDDDRYYVHWPDEDQNTRARFKDFSNAVQFCRRRTPAYFDCKAPE